MPESNWCGGDLQTASFFGLDRIVQSIVSVDGVPTSINDRDGLPILYARFGYAFFGADERYVTIERIPSCPLYPVQRTSNG